MATASLESGNAASRSVTWGMGTFVAVAGTQAWGERSITTPLALFKSARVVVNGWRSKIATMAIM